jgi:hypothetical protein
LVTNPTKGVGGREENVGVEEDNGDGGGRWGEKKMRRGLRIRSCRK